MEIFGQLLGYQFKSPYSWDNIWNKHSSGKHGENPWALTNSQKLYMGISKYGTAVILQVYAKIMMKVEVESKLAIRIPLGNLYILEYFRYKYYKLVLLLFTHISDNMVLLIDMSHKEIIGKSLGHIHMLS